MTSDLFGGKIISKRWASQDQASYYFQWSKSEFSLLIRPHLNISPAEVWHILLKTAIVIGFHKLFPLLEQFGNEMSGFTITSKFIGYCSVRPCSAFFSGFLQSAYYYFDYLSGAFFLIFKTNLGEMKATWHSSLLRQPKKALVLMLILNCMPTSFALNRTVIPSATIHT